VKYPSISQIEMKDFVSNLRNGSAEVEPKVLFSGEENSLPDDLIEGFVRNFIELQEACSRGLTKSKDKKFSEFEQQASPLVVALLKKLPLKVQFDPGFWSYLSFRVANVISWRYPPNDKEGWGKNFVQTHTQSDFVDGFLPRLAIKGLIEQGSDKAAALTQQDFWRSHVLRVKTGFSPKVSQAFAELVVDEGIVVESQRAIAKSIRSQRSNVIFELLSSDQARALVNRSK
jgi:hypothetical protein